MTREHRTIHTAIMQTPTERAELEDLAASLGMPMSTVIRFALKRLSEAERVPR